MKPPLSVVAHVKVLRKRIVNKVFPISMNPLGAHKPRPHPFGLIAFWLLLSSAAMAQQAPTRGTALFVIRTPREIVAAADSSEFNTELRAPNPKPVCKIRPFGDAFVAINGVSTDPRSGYSIYAVIEQAGKADGDLPQRIRVFERLVTASLGKALKRMKREDPAAYQMYLTSPLGAAFFGIEGADLVLYRRRFPISGVIPEGVDIERQRCPGDCPIGIGIVYVQPPKTNFFMRLREEFPGFEKGRVDLDEIARRFVQMQIDAKDPTVGPPIDILRITKDGAQWDGKEDEECPKTQRPATPTPPSRQTKPKGRRRKPR